MRKKTLALLTLAAAVVGCSQEPTRSAPQARTASPVTAAPAGSEREIATAAESFMRSILAGDATQAARMLTAKAAQRYAADRSVLPAMGMRVEQLAIGEVRLLNAQEAAAQCLVTEAGTEAAQELCCLLKRESAGWRVAGVAANAADESPTVISFEGDPPAPAVPSQLVERPDAASETPRTAAGTPAGTVR